MTLIYFCLCIALVCSLTSCMILNIQPCPESVPQKCVFQIVALDPYRGTTENGSYILDRGTNVTWTFTVLPEFNAEQLTLVPGGYEPGKPDKVDPTKDHNACHYTKCPIKAYQKFIIAYPTPVRLSYPSGTVIVKWKLENEANESCCFLAPIEFV